ncbi:Eukaryotic translation initiation factor 2-alpha kinase [Allomyces arbusculus]|nr:Eukaryotic translation initiation factor 2-alpha kinase [Allomyces arbusculus]
MGSGSARESVVSLDDTVEPVAMPGMAGSVASSDSWDDSTWAEEKHSSAEPAQPDASDAFHAPDVPDSPLSERLPGAYWQSSPEDSSSSLSSSSSRSSLGSSQTDSSYSSTSSHAASRTTASAGTAFTLPFSLDDDQLPPNHGVVVEDQMGTANADHPERRQQARLLLVALLENFALLYSPTNNKALFQVLCEKLAVMGVITEEDFADSFSAVRSVYKRAFKELVMQALVATRADRQRRGLPTSPSSSLLIEFPGAGTKPAAGLPTRHARAPAPPGTGARLAGLLDLQTTRYTSDFHEIKRLGKGGFGSVFHVRHKLDGREYAIKKIPVSRNKDFERILREVKVLARMDHINIVRYYSAWLEHDEVQFPGQRRHRSDEDVDLSSDADDYTESTATSTAMTDSLRNVTSVELTDSQLSDAVQFTADSNAPDAPTTYRASSSTTSNYPPPTQRNRPLTNRSVATGTSAASSSFASDDDDEDDESAADSTSFGAPLARRRRTHTANYIPHRPLMVFVQMEVAFCSLHDYFLHRNSLVHVADRDLTAENNYVFLSILNAVSYIHDRGVSHRDITPRNLFLVRRARDQGRPALTAAAAAEVGTSPLLEFMQVPTLDDIIVKLGDFGLVTVHAGHAASMAGPGPTVPPTARGAPLAASLRASPAGSSDERSSSDSSSSDECSDDEESDDDDLANSPDTGKLYRSNPVAWRTAPDPVAARTSSTAATTAAVRPLAPPRAAASPSRPPTPSAAAAAAIRARLPVVSTPTLGIGTETYSAPEQLRKRPGKYDWHPIKSDIYSLGIILFELFWPFATQMERIMSLQKLKSRARALPPDFIRQWPQHAALVLWLTAENPALRPTPGELMAVFPPPAVPPGSAPGSGRGRKRTGSGVAATLRPTAPPTPSASVMPSPARMEDQVWSPTASVLRDACTSTASLPARPGCTTPPVLLVRADSDGDDPAWLRERVAVLERTAADQARQLAAKDEEIRVLREALATMQADRDGVTRDSGVAGRC